MARGLVLSLVLLAGCVMPPQSGSVEPTNGGPQSGSPVTTAMPASEPAASASAAASLSPSQSPSAPPSPTPDPAALELDTTSCEGGVALDWSASTAADFHHYSALRSPEREIAPDWPPIAPAVDWGDTYSTDRFVTSGADTTVIRSGRPWFYRVMAYDIENRVVGSSPVRAGRLEALADLGAVTADVQEDGRVRIGWQAYGGFSACFSNYRVMVTSAGAAPAVLGVISQQTANELVTGTLHPGTTVTLSVEALRTTTLGPFTVAEAQSLTYAVP
jgi:hypothetical protein